MATPDDAAGAAELVSAEDKATILERVMDEAAHADDDVNTAEGLVYRVNNFELEVERCAQPNPLGSGRARRVGPGPVVHRFSCVDNRAVKSRAA